jgi:hypothetical protein
VPLPLCICFSLNVAIVFVAVAVAVAVALFIRNEQIVLYDRHCRIMPVIWLNHARGKLHQWTPITPAYG